MIGIQMLSARIGWVTRQGLATNIGKICPRWLTLALVGLLVVANTINIAADVAAMAEAVQAPRRRAAAALRARVRRALHRHAGLLLVRAHGARPQVADAGAVRLRRRGPGRLGAVGAGARRVAAALGVPARRHVGQGLRGDGRRRARHDDQPVPLLLAGDAGGRGQPAPAARAAACARTRRTSREHLRASSSTPSSAWGSRTWSRCASSSRPR